MKNNFLTIMLLFISLLCLSAQNKDNINNNVFEKFNDAVLVLDTLYVQIINVVNKDLFTDSLIINKFKYSMQQPLSNIDLIRYFQINFNTKDSIVLLHNPWLRPTKHSGKKTRKAYYDLLEDILIKNMIPYNKIESFNVIISVLGNEQKIMSINYHIRYLSKDSFELNDKKASYY